MHFISTLFALLFVVAFIPASLCASPACSAAIGTADGCPSPPFAGCYLTTDNSVNTGVCSGACMFGGVVTYDPSACCLGMFLGPIPNDNGPPPENSPKYICDASASGDPQFIGFLGQSYNFQGHPDKVYQIMSDKVVSVNARFSRLDHLGYNHNGTQNYWGTYMSAFGIYLGTVAVIEISLDSYHPTENHVSLAINSLQTNISLNSPVYLGGCSRIVFEPPKVLIEYGGYIFVVEYNEGTWDVKARHLDLSVVLPPDALNRKNGGILGQSTVLDISLDESLFIVHPSTDLFSLNSPTCQFDPASSPAFVDGSCPYYSENKASASIVHGI